VSGKNWESYPVVNAAFRVECRLAKLVKPKAAATLPVKAG
jgi:hypothetical protein